MSRLRLEPAATAEAIRALGLEFPGPVGLGAGFDRYASHIAEVRGWGFGFVELGTVTPQPVAGHNPGAAELAANLSRRRKHRGSPVLGVNLGIQPGTPLEAACQDYVHGMNVLWRAADYLVLNFTSQHARPLRDPRLRPILLTLLATVMDAHRELARQHGRAVPLLVKWPVGPNMQDAVAVAGRLRGFGYAGVVAAFEPQAPGFIHWEAWVPAACRALVAAMGPACSLIAVGGVDCAERARALCEAGAALVELYGAFVQQGPALVRALARAWADAGRLLHPA